VKIRWVIKNGEVYDGETLRREWPSATPPPTFFWRKEGERGEVTREARHPER
jgi:hypothetical protein